MDLQIKCAVLRWFFGLEIEYDVMEHLTKALYCIYINSTVKD